jgi:hypothetical protein
MKKHNFLITAIKTSFLFLLALNFSSCDKCKGIECFTPAEPFYFQLIDKETNQNLLQNGTYSFSDIHIKSVSENKFHVLKLDSIESNGQKQAVLIDNEIGWETGQDKKNYILMVKDSLEFDFIYDTDKKRGECCTYYQINEISSSQIEIIVPDFNEGFFYKLAL